MSCLISTKFYFFICEIWREHCYASRRATANHKHQKRSMCVCFYFDSGFLSNKSPWEGQRWGEHTKTITAGKMGVTDTGRPIVVDSHSRDYGKVTLIQMRDTFPWVRVHNSGSCLWARDEVARSEILTKQGNRKANRTSFTFENTNNSHGVWRYNRLCKIPLNSYFEIFFRYVSKIATYAKNGFFYLRDI